MQFHDAPAGELINLTVEERQLVEPSNYSWESGWVCFNDKGADLFWYFVSDDGRVDQLLDYIDGDNITSIMDVGVAPELRKQSDRDEAANESTLAEQSRFLSDLHDTD